MRWGILGILFCTLIFFTQKRLWSPKKIDKINGISLVAPPKATDLLMFDALDSSGSNWVAIIPYGFTPRVQNIVISNVSNQWWGETKKGVIAMIRRAQTKGMKVMIKPHVWVQGEGWPGSFDLQTESKWHAWEQSYENYIITYAQVADSLQVDLFCIGTEYRMSVQKRSLFWKQLIAKVRSLYRGPITYAANWDNYQNIDFWEDLDFIGIDAYFPLLEDTNPSIDQLRKAWKLISLDLKSMSLSYDLPILFTEYGYQSVLGSAGNHWELNQEIISMSSQSIAYQALFDAFWQEPWFAGGFLWKWHFKKNAGGIHDPNFTPQGKPVLQIIQRNYKN